MSNGFSRTHAAVFAAGTFLGVMGAMTSAAQAEMYGYYYVGLADTRDSDVHIRQPSLATDVTYHDVEYRGQSLQSPLFYGFKLGTYLRNPWWLGVELEFSHYKAYAETKQTYDTSGTVLGAPAPSGPMNQYVEDLNISHGVNLFMLNVVARDGFWKSPQFPNGQVQVYGGLGFGGLLMHPESKINGVRAKVGYEWNKSPAAQFFAGVRGMPFSLGWRYGNPSLFTEYKFAIANADFKVDQGRGSLHLRSHLFVAGIGWSF